jgi:hypothetical protein
VVHRCSDLLIVLARKYVEVHLHALQTMTEQFQLYEWDIVVLEDCIVVQKRYLDCGMHLITQPVHVLPCSNSATKGSNGINRILYHDIAAQTIT